MTRYKILLVDDEKSLAAMLKLNLEAMGDYEVKIENNSLKAVQTAIEFRPQLILLDVIMPHKEGPDVAIDVKSTAAIKNVPIVFLTATVTPQEVEEQDGFIGGHPFVAKPSNLVVLLHTIEKNCVPADS